MQTTNQDGIPAASESPLDELARAFAHLLALAILLLSFGAQAQSAFLPPERLTVVTDVNYPPYLFRADDGQLRGIIDEKWALWSKRTGIAVQMVGMEWALAQQSVQNGTADVIDALTYTEVRSSLYDFSPPYALVEARVYFNQTISGISDVTSMRGFTIGAKDGSACGDWLRQHGVEAIRDYPSSERVVHAAGTGEVRLFCMDASAAQYFLFKQGLADAFRQTPPLYSGQFHWAVKKGRPELRDFIQRGFEKITPAELADIDSRWLGNPLRFPISSRYLYYMAFLVLAILALAFLLVLWNGALRRRVSARTAELSLALEALREHAAIVEDLYNNAPCGYHSLNADGVFVQMNDTELKWLGYAREEVIGKLGFTDIVTADVRRDWSDNFARFKQQGAISDIEFELVRKDGSTMLVLLSATAVREAHGNYVMSRSTIYDITERKKIEQALRDSEVRYREMVEVLAESVVLVDHTGQIIACNASTSRIFGLSLDELLATNLHRPPLHAVFEDGAVVEVEKTPILEVLRTGKPKVGVIVGRYRRDGSLVWLSNNYMPLFKPGETRPYAAVASGTDITEHKLAQQALQASEMRYRTVIDTMAEGVILRGMDDKVIICNRAAEHILGMPAQEIMGSSSPIAGQRAVRPDGSPFPDDERVSRVTKRTGQPCTDVVTGIQRDDGSTTWISANSAPLFAEDGVTPYAIFTTFSDITGHMRASQREHNDAERMRTLSRQLITAQETERRAIARNLHDEVGQVLTAINVMLQMMKGKIPDAALGGQLDEGIWLVNRAIDDIRNVSLRLRPAILDDLGLVPALRWLVAQQNIATGIEISLELGELPSDVPPEIATGCFRIVQEAITNAIRYSRADGLKVRLAEADNRIEVEIQDNGVGFDRAKVREKAAQGHGSGLSGMRERAELLGGRWEVRSSPGAGTLVYASLPL